MNKKMLGAVGLSLIIGGQCLYAEEVAVSDQAKYTQEVEVNNESKVETQEITTTTENVEDVSQQAHIDDEVDFDIIQGDNPVQNPNQGDVVSDTSENLSNKIILTLDSKVAIVDGQEKTLICAPAVVSDTTLLPMRFVGDEVIGAQIDWNQEMQTVTMTKDGVVVSVTIGKKIATVDGLEVELQAAPIIKDGTTLVPLRFLSESFNISIDYNSETKKIILDKGTESNTLVPNQAPIADFYFPEDYVAGQVVSVVDESYDPDGDVIKDRLWAVVGDKTITNKELSNMFKKPAAGNYTIGLQVQDSKGQWSDWTYKTVTILPNEAPVITSLQPTKSSFAQGEKIEFMQYTYENESWEEVKEGKWTYRSVSEAENRATLGKPNAIFTEGDYIVTLYLDDAYGNRSKGFETTVHISGEARDTEFNHKFSSGLIGEWIDNFQGTNYLNYTPVNILNTSYKYGTLIMSDSPEEVQGTGILYRDTINGSGRLLIHHINQSNTTEKQRLALIVENPTDKQVTVKLLNKSIKGPATDILRVGQLSLNEYLSGTVPTETIILQPGEKKFIYDKNWSLNSCISAHIDVETDGDARFIVANLSGSDTLKTIDSLYYYPADGVHYSGTYDKVGINYTLNLSGTQAEKLTIGTVNSGEWVVGYDERTGAAVQNAGNFGVSYYITVTAQEDMGVILNNRGGMFQGAIKWNDKVYNMPGRGTFIGTTTKAVVLGTIKKGETVTIEYLLPNGSAAPTLIGFIPKSMW